MHRPPPLFTSSSGHIPRQSSSASTAHPVIGTTSLHLLYLFLAFQLADQILLPILIATFLFSKTVKRHPTVVNVCMTWIITGFLSSLLFYAGKHVGPEPPALLCVSQASLLDGVVPMNSISVLALMFQVNFSIRKPKAQPNGIRTYALLVAPYITFFCFATSAAVLAVQRPQNVNRGRRFFYCSLSSPISNAFALFSAIALITALGFAVSLGLFLRNNWRALRQAGSIDLQFLSRVGGFVLYVFISLIVSLLSIFAPRNPLPDLFAASAGTALFLFLGTQRDVWRAWFRLRPRSAVPAAANNNINLMITSNSVVKDFKTVEPDFDFIRRDYHSGGKNKGLDVESMGSYTAQEMDLDNTNVTEDSSGASAKKQEEASAMHNIALPMDGYRLQYPRPSLMSDASGSAEAGQGVQSQGRGQGAPVKIALPSYPFSRPGMI